jgi:hypothetical protein
VHIVAGHLSAAGDHAGGGRPIEEASGVESTSGRRPVANEAPDDQALSCSAATAAATAEVAAALTSAEHAREQLDDRSSHDQTGPFAGDYLIARRRAEDAAVAERTLGDDLGRP